MLLCRKSEKNRNLKADEHHGTGGDYTVEYVRYSNPLHKLFLDSTQQVSVS
jgi:hypothetical protein